MAEITPIALPWYESELDFNAVAAMLPASEREDAFSYHTFRANVERHEKELKGKGLIAHRVPIDAITLKGWCDANDLPVCRKSIAEYCTIALGLMLRGNWRN
jgi:hypothetical protein